MSDAEIDRIVDQLCDLPPGERRTWFDGHPEATALRAQVEAILEHFDRLAGDADVLPDPMAAFRAEESPRHPEQLGAYRILEPLGEGGMGVVYLAEQSDPRRRVAIKVVRGGVLHGEALRRFEQEATLLARLQHPGIAQLIELGRTGEGQAYLVMEYIAGLQITTYVEQAGLTRDERVELLAELADAVQHAHMRGVVHRDLKPGNVLVTAEGQVKVIDFGVARALDDEALATLHTQAGQVLGTLAYMSPEQMDGAPDGIDSRADVYALGVLAYEVLGGQLPLDLGTASVGQAVRVLAEQDPRPLGRVAPACRGDVETVVGKALEKDPERRYPSAAAFAADLRRLLAHQPVEARAPTLSYQLSRLARRHRGLFAGAAAAVLALAVGGGLALNQALANRALARDEADARGRAESEALRATAAARDAVAARDEAEAARAEAERARQAEVRRAEDLEAVVNFHSERAGFKDVARLAESLRVRLAQALEDGLRQRRVPAADVATGRAQLEDLLALIDLPGVAAGILWQELHAPSREIISRRFADRPEVRARLLLELASVAAILADGPTEESILREAWTLLRAARGLGDGRTIQAQIGLAQGLGRSGDNAAALELLEDVRERLLATFGPASEEAARLWLSLADVQGALGDETAAVEPLEHALAAARAMVAGAAPSGRDYLVVALRRLGKIRARQGQLELAETLLREALEAAADWLDEDRVVARYVQGNLGIVLVARGELAEARELLEASHEGLRRAVGSRHEMTLEVHGYRLLALYSLDLFEQCVPLAAEASALLEDAPDADSRQVIRASALHGACLRRLGRLDEARAVLEPLEVATRHLLPDSPGRAEVGGTLWWLYHDLDQQHPGQGWDARRDAFPRPSDAP